MEFIRSFQSEAPLKRGAVSAQDASLQERVLAQVGMCAGQLAASGCPASPPPVSPESELSEGCCDSSQSDKCTEDLGTCWS